MKFKVGDKVTAEHLPNKVLTIESVDDKFYYCGNGDEGQPLVIPIDKEYQFDLYKPKKTSWLGKFFKKKNNTMGQELEKEIYNKVMKLYTVPTYDQLNDFAHYFVEWGMNHAKIKED